MTEPWRIVIEPSALVDGIAVQIARRVGDHVERLTFTANHEVLPYAEGAVLMPSPSLTVDDRLGRALLDALAGYYGGTTGGLQQRADFEHERSRVDRLIGALIGRTAP